eukprot:5619406-Prymnesium_polylepis.2
MGACPTARHRPSKLCSTARADRADSRKRAQLGKCAELPPWGTSPGQTIASTKGRGSRAIRATSGGSEPDNVVFCRSKTASCDKRSSHRGTVPDSEVNCSGGKRSRAGQSQAAGGCAAVAAVRRDMAAGSRASLGHL